MRDGEILLHSNMECGLAQLRKTYLARSCNKKVTIGLKCVHKKLRMLFFFLPIAH